jgi:hypothetical protein
VSVNPAVEKLEIVLNLWYVYDDIGAIYSLRARAYVASGSDEDKLSFLQHHAMLDFLIAKPFPVPERLHTTVAEVGEKQKMAFVLKQAVEVMGGARTLFEEVFVEMEKELPAQTKLSIGSKPLVCITPIFAYPDGTLEPRFAGQEKF